jgi:hypothetical protein
LYPSGSEYPYEAPALALAAPRPRTDGAAHCSQFPSGTVCRDLTAPSNSTHRTHVPARANSPTPRRVVQGARICDTQRLRTRAHRASAQRRRCSLLSMPARRICAARGQRHEDATEEEELGVGLVCSAQLFRPWRVISPKSLGLSDQDGCQQAKPTSFTCPRGMYTNSILVARG